MAVAIRFDLMDTPKTFTQMSEPKRYGHKAIIYPKSDDDTYITIPIEESNGQWVSYTEYIMLKAELRSKVMDGISDIGQLGEQSAEIANLKAENEELHKDYEALADEHTKLIDRNARLKAEVERLTAMANENDHLHKGIYSLSLNVVQLKDEVERLRKAGDLLCFHYISLGRERWPDDPLPSSVKAWNAAKDGKPSV